MTSHKANRVPTGQRTSSSIVHLALSILILAIVSVSSIGTAKAHHWYPKECCAGHDCMPADDIVAGEDGRKIVIVR